MEMAVREGRALPRAPNNEGNFAPAGPGITPRWKGIANMGSVLSAGRLTAGIGACVGLKTAIVDGRTMRGPCHTMWLGPVAVSGPWGAGSKPARAARPAWGDPDVTGAGTYM